MQDCDRLAASPGDPDRASEGIPFAAINTDAAIRACEAAVTEFPESLRLMFQLGRALDAAGRHGEAIQRYEKSAQSDYAAAQNNLGFAYLYGLGTAPDYATAATWFRRAADNGDPYGYTNLGHMYQTGTGGEQDYKKAAELFEKAARQDEPTAQGRLGLLYFGGLGVDQDVEKAAKWLLAAGEDAEPFPLFTLGYYIFLDRDSGMRDVEKAFYWLRLAAERGSVDAQKQLAYMYLRIVEVHPKSLYGRSKDEAMDWINRSVEAEYPSALISLAFLHSTGTAVPKDCQRARELIRTAQDLEDNRAEESGMIPDNPNMPMGFVELGERYAAVGNCRD